MWHEKDATDRHSKMVGVVDTLSHRHTLRMTEIQRFWRLYGLDPEAFYGSTQITLGEAQAININVVRQVVDAFVAKIARSRPRIMHVPVDGDWSQQRKARKRTRFVDGVWYETGFRRDARIVALEAAVSGTGFLKGFPEHEKIKHEVVSPEEIWIDTQDARYGTPRNIYQRRHVDRQVLAAQFREHETAIARADSGDEGVWPGFSSTVDQVLVTEGWHLPSSPDADDGRHVMAVSSCTLVDEPWEWDRFPFATLRFSPAMRGFWARGIVAQIEGIQAAIYRLLDQVMVQLGEHGKSRVYLERGSKVNPGRFTDDTRSDFVEYTGAPPVVVPPAMVVPKEVYEMIWQLASRAFQQIGVSETSAQSLKPAGLDSGVALRNYQDIETGRLALSGHEFEQWHLDVADLDLRTASILAQRPGGYSALHLGQRYGRRTAERVRYWDTTQGEEYVLRAYPTSLLPETPAGKLAMIGELESRGYVTPEESMELLDLPDLDKALSSKTAAIRTIDWFIEGILDDGTYRPPDPAMPLDVAYMRARDAYLLGVQDGAPDDRLGLLREWMQAVLDMQEEAQAATAPTEPAGPPQEPVPEQAGPMSGPEQAGPQMGGMQ